MRKAMTLFGLGTVAALLLLAGCASTQEMGHGGQAESMQQMEHEQHQHGGDFTQHYEGTLFQVSKNGLYSMELLLDQGTLVTGENSFQVIVHNPQDKDVSGAAVTAKAFQPAEPSATMRSVPGMDREGGLYTFSGLMIDDPGHWKIAVEVSKAGKKDAATFDFPNVTMAMGGRAPEGSSKEGSMAHDHGAGQMHHHAETMERPENIDTSTEVMSEKGLFQVAYDTEVKPIPIGRIHRWRIQVLDAAGNPVQQARILIDGDMPEHGHGLPTEPQMTGNLGNGVYEIGGMRFSMPGWWVLEFQILTQDKRDKAVFNLLLE